jgi:hypothetical protein
VRSIPAVAALLVGLVLAYLATPWIYRHVPSDLSPSLFVVETLHTKRPRLVVFGDSRGQADIDARLLGGVNLSTPEQSLAQMVLLADALPSSVERVIVVIPPEDDGRPLALMSDNALWMSGLRPSARAKEIVTRCTGFAPFARNELEQRFAARWVLRQGLETVLRNRVRPTSQIYATRVTPSRFAEEAAAARAYEPQVTPEVRCLLAALAKSNVTFIVPPIHPVAATRGYLAYASSANVPIVDLSRAMPDDAFADPRHLTHAGARAFTTRLR